MRYLSFVILVFCHSYGLAQHNNGKLSLFSTFGIGAAISYEPKVSSLTQFCYGASLLGSYKVDARYNIGMQISGYKALGDIVGNGNSMRIHSFAADFLVGKQLNEQFSLYSGLGITQGIRAGSEIYHNTGFVFSSTYFQLLAYKTVSLPAILVFKPRKWASLSVYNSLRLNGNYTVFNVGYHFL